jgi:hypothetical protein
MAVQVIDGSVTYSQTEEPHYTTIDDMDRIFAEMEAATAGMDFLPRSSIAV